VNAAAPVEEPSTTVSGRSNAAPYSILGAGDQLASGEGRLYEAGLIVEHPNAVLTR
jgi:hypothetical protein